MSPSVFFLAHRSFWFSHSRITLSTATTVIETNSSNINNDNDGGLPQDTNSDPESTITDQFGIRIHDSPLSSLLQDLFWNISGKA